MTPLQIARLMHREDVRAVHAVGRALPAVARAVEAIVAALSRGGRLFFVGAGTSGRLGVLEAAECPPTFGTPPGLVQAVMAGGRASVFRAREGAEDDAHAARRIVRARVRPADALVGVSASAVTPFVLGALETARRAGAVTVLVTCNPLAARAWRPARTARRATPGRRDTIVVALEPGPEVVAGSTRLKAGTATKLVLNALTTASMARLGRVWGNRMIDVQPRSRKLRERALALVSELGGVERRRAARALGAAGDSVRLAVVLARTGWPPARARRALREAGGSLRPFLGNPRGDRP